MTGGNKNPYDASFYAKLEDAVRDSARQIVPIVVNLLRPRSVVDVGCGTGIWLAEFLAEGVPEYLGVDGDHVDRALLQINPANFLPADLTAPLAVAGRRFDLAMSLEVAEHLPQGCAESFVESLTRLAPVVMFSAAIPQQGGTNHINERWQSYWAGLFAARGYVAVDAIRPRVWNNPRVAWYYAQNTILYVRKDDSAIQQALRADLLVQENPLDLVHPTFYLSVLRPTEQRPKSTSLHSPLASTLRRAVRAAFGWAAGKRVGS